MHDCASILDSMYCFHDFSHGASHPFIPINSVECILHLFHIFLYCSFINALNNFYNAYNVLYYPNLVLRVYKCNEWGCIRRDGMHHANNCGNKEIPLEILSRILAQSCVTLCLNIMYREGLHMIVLVSLRVYNYC